MNENAIQELVTMEQATAMVEEEQKRIIDLILMMARPEGWCGEVSRALDAVFPLHEGEWRTTDGFDVQGYDVDGYDRNGYDQDGFKRDGYDERGYNREGVDAQGNESPTRRWCDSCVRYHD